MSEAGIDIPRALLTGNFSKTGRQSCQFLTRDFLQKTTPLPRFCPIDVPPVTVPPLPPTWLPM